MKQSYYRDLEKSTPSRKTIYQKCTCVLGLLACQKRLIKTFINSVFVHDDKVVLTFNYFGDRRTMTLKEIDGGLQQGIRIPRAVVHQK